METVIERLTVLVRESLAALRRLRVDPDVNVGSSCPRCEGTGIELKKTSQRAR